MFDLSDPNTFWLNVTNIGLGFITFVCLIVVGYGVVQEVAARVKKSALVETDDHALVVTGLGITMADGGERIDKNALKVSPQGIVRETKSKRRSK